MCSAEALPEADSAPTWLARFSIGSGNIGRVGHLRLVAPVARRVHGRSRTRYGWRVGYTLINRDDPSIESFRGAFFKIRRALGTTAIGINEIRFPPGIEGPEHDELDTGHEEIYIVLEGSGTFTIDGEAVPVVVGDYLRVDADARRQAGAGPDGMIFIAAGAKSKPEYDGRESL